MPKIQASAPAASAVQSPVVVTGAAFAPREFLPAVDSSLALLAGVSSLLSEGHDSCEVDWCSAAGIVDLAVRELLALRERATEKIRHAMAHEDDVDPVVAALAAIVIETMGGTKPFDSESYLPAHLVELGRKAVEDATGRRIEEFVPVSTIEPEVRS